MVVETINLIGSCNGGKVGYTVYRYIKDNYTIINYETLLDESIYYFLIIISYLSSKYLYYIEL